MPKFSELVASVDTTSKAAADAKVAVETADKAAAEAVTAVVASLTAHGGTIAIAAPTSASTPDVLVYSLDTSTGEYAYKSIPLDPEA